MFDWSVRMKMSEKREHGQRAAERSVRRAWSGFSRLLVLLLCLAIPCLSRALDFTYATQNGQVTITGHTGPGGNVVIPNMINGLPVTSIGANAFKFCGTLTGVTMPNSITSIGGYAFYQCNRLELLPC